MVVQGWLLHIIQTGYRLDVVPVPTYNASHVGTGNDLDYARDMLLRVILRPPSYVMKTDVNFIYVATSSINEQSFIFLDVKIERFHCI